VRRLRLGVAKDLADLEVVHSSVRKENPDPIALPATEQRCAQGSEDGETPASHVRIHREDESEGASLAAVQVRHSDDGVHPHDTLRDAAEGLREASVESVREIREVRRWSGLIRERLRENPVELFDESPSVLWKAR
jgi:hypothetical protein